MSKERTSYGGSISVSHHRYIKEFDDIGKSPQADNSIADKYHTLSEPLIVNRANKLSIERPLSADNK